MIDLVDKKIYTLLGQEHMYSSINSTHFKHQPTAHCQTNRAYLDHFKPEQTKLLAQLYSILQLYDVRLTLSRNMWYFYYITTTDDIKHKYDDWRELTINDDTITKWVTRSCTLTEHVKDITKPTQISLKVISSAPSKQSLTQQIINYTLLLNFSSTSSTVPVVLMWESSRITHATYTVQVRSHFLSAIEYQVTRRANMPQYSFSSQTFKFTQLRSFEKLPLTQGMP